MEKKYEFTDETIEVDGHTLHRIRALRNFGTVEKGDLGGFIESEENLSHEGDCWVYPDAKVYENALVLKNATISLESTACGNVIITDGAWVIQRVFLSGNVHVMSYALLCGDLNLSGSMTIFGYDTIITGAPNVFDKEGVIQ